MQALPMQHRGAQVDGSGPELEGSLGQEPFASFYVLACRKELPGVPARVREKFQAGAAAQSTLATPRRPPGRREDTSCRPTWSRVRMSGPEMGPHALLCTSSKKAGGPNPPYACAIASNDVLSRIPCSERAGLRS